MVFTICHLFVLNQKKKKKACEAGTIISALILKVRKMKFLPCCFWMRGLSSQGQGHTCLAHAVFPAPGSRQEGGPQ